MSHDVARALLPAASTIVSTLFSSPYFPPRRKSGIGGAVLPSQLAGFRVARKGVETSLDAADTSVRATCSAHILSMTSGGQRLVSTHFGPVRNMEEQRHPIPFNRRYRCGRRTEGKSVEMSLDAADTSVRATSSAHIRSKTSGDRKSTRLNSSHLVISY